MRKFYAETWNAWYAKCPGTTPATLVLHWDEDGTTHYRKSTDEIHIYFYDTDCEDMIREDNGFRSPIGQLGWFAWKGFLVHEMLHEYQFKCITAPSEDGRTLRARQKRNFDGSGHEDFFYTAIAEKAAHFGVTPDTLVAEL